MALRSPKFTRGDRVMHDDFACEVLEVKGKTLTIRNKYGFQESIPIKGTQHATADQVQ